MQWLCRWLGTRRALSIERHKRRLAEERIAMLEEMLASYRDTLETYQTESQARTAAAMVERELYRAERGYK